MKKGITTGILTAGVLILCLACNTIQLGANFEPRQNSYAVGGAFGGDLGDYVENSISYIHNPYPETDGIDAHGIGYDFNIKYPFHLAKNNLSLFPILGVESRFIFNISEPATEPSDYLGFGIKIGAGFDVSFTPAFYLRGTAFYQPDFTTFMNSYSGFRFNAALGYRTYINNVRYKVQDGRSELAAQRKEKERKQRELAAEREKEQGFQNAVAADPDNPKPLYDLGWYYYSNGKNVSAADPWEKALILDPNYRVKDGKAWSASTALDHGVAASGNIQINDFSLQMLLAFAYYDAATKSGKSPDSVVPVKDKNAALEKALTLFRNGYNIDIAGGRNSGRNVKTMYLGAIAKTLDLLGRNDEAIAAYIELYRHTEITDALYARIASALNIPSYYVSAGGNNANDGLSEAKPLRSLALAYEKACAGEIKRITVIGRLDYQNEEGKDDEAVFALIGTENGSEIVVTGKRGVSGADRAILSGAGSKKSVVNVHNNTARFEYIEVSGGELNANGLGGNGIIISSATGIISISAVIRANKGRGVLVWKGKGTLAGGEINNNENSGVMVLIGAFNMEKGSIKNNKAERGGGVEISFSSGSGDYDSSFTMSGGTITGNTASKDGGGVNNRGTFTMSGGTITGNTASEDGGGVNNSGTFTMTSGTISGNRAAYGGGVDIRISFFQDGCIFTMSGGTISGNTASRYGGGVYISGVKEESTEIFNGGIFKQSGGSITNNSAMVGGGVDVNNFNGRYDKTGGSVSGNSATHYSKNAIPGSNENINREQGSLGSGW